MKITEAKLTKRFNTGDYEFEEHTLSAVVENESGASVLQCLREQILEAFSGEVSSTKEEKPKAEKKAAKKKEEKKNAKQANPVDDEESDDEVTSSEDSGDADEGAENDEATDSKDRDDSDDSADDGESDETDEEAKPAKSSKASSKPSAEKGKKSFKKKPQAYDRSIEQHKDIFSGVVRSVSPDWKKSDELKARAKKSSEEMEGENFLDENGEVYPTFKTMVARLMKGKTK